MLVICGGGDPQKKSRKVIMPECWNWTKDKLNVIPWVTCVILHFLIFLLVAWMKYVLNHLWVLCPTSVLALDSSNLHGPFHDSHLDWWQSGNLVWEQHCPMKLYFGMILKTNNILVISSLVFHLSNFTDLNVMWRDYFNVDYFNQKLSN